MMSSSRELKLGALLSYATIALNLMAGLLYTPWMVKTIGQSDYALYVLASTLIGFVAMDFGLGSAVTKFLAQYRASGDEAGERRFLGVALKIFGAVAVAVFLALLVLYFQIDNIYTKLTITEIERLRTVYAISGLFVVVSFPFKPLEGVLLAGERFVFLKVLELATKAATVVTVVLALVLGYGLYGVVLATAFVGILRAVVQYGYVRRRMGVRASLDSAERSVYVAVLRFGAWTTLTLVALRFTYLIAPTILGALADSGAIAVFGIANVIEGYVFMFAGALQGLFLPRGARILVKPTGRNAEIESLLIRVGRVQLLVVTLIFVGFLVLGRQFLDLWLGADYVAAYPLVLLLIAPGLVSYTHEIGHTALSLLDKLQYRAGAAFLVGGVSVAVSFILVPTQGALGSGLAIAAGNILGSILFMSLVFSRVLGIRMGRFYRDCHGRMLIPASLTAVAGTGLVRLLPASTWLSLVAHGLFVTGVYALLVWWLFMNGEERQLVRSVALRLQSRPRGSD